MASVSPLTGERLAPFNAEHHAAPRASAGRVSNDESDRTPNAPASEVCAAALYRKLTGVSPEAAIIDSDEDFDRHVLACVLALAATEPASLTSQTGLAEAELESLISRTFVDSKFSAPPGSDGARAAGVDEDEIEIVRDLLAANRSTQGDCGLWLAAMVARRALEPNHLWEDLGLRNRTELTRLLERHFRPLAIRNDKNMRWKRFIYRVMCEADGFVMCSTPVCTNCADYNQCFGEEAGLSRVAGDGVSKETMRD